MKIKFLFVSIMLVVAACRQTAPTVNQNPQPSTSPSAIPVVSISENRNASNVPETTASKTPKTNPIVSPTPKATIAPAASPNDSKFKNYTAKGVIKKIDAANNSITIDHEDIGDYMVGMEMPFPVVDRNILKNLKVGDSVTFVLETGVGVERIISIKKN